MSKLQDQLKTLRSDKKLTQADVAKIVSVHQVTYQGWEKGKSEPDIDKLIKLADYYRVSADYLIGRYN
jgi:transcriptional regulator with XRE-family HTH domain